MFCLLSLLLLATTFFSPHHYSSYLQVYSADKRLITTLHGIIIISAATMIIMLPFFINKSSQTQWTQHKTLDDYLSLIWFMFSCRDATFWAKPLLGRPHCTLSLSQQQIPFHAFQQKLNKWVHQYVFFIQIF